MADATDFETTIERDVEGDTIHVHYSMIPIPIDISFDMATELGEMASPLANLNNSDDIGSAFGEMARTLKKKGGFKYGMKVFRVAKLRRNSEPLTDLGIFKLSYDGKGGLVEFTKALEWVLAEQFADFFSELLGSIGQLSQGQSQDTEAKS